MLFLEELTVCQKQVEQTWVHPTYSEDQMRVLSSSHYPNILENVQI